MVNSEFIGRQPIVNRSQAIVGYRLLFGGAPQIQYDPDHSGDTASTRERTEALKFEEILGGATGFIEIDSQDLDSAFVRALNSTQFVLELGTVEDADRTAIAKKCKELRADGFRICLGNYQRRDNRQSLLEFANYIKIDAIATSESDIKALIRRVRKHGTQIIASRVDLPAQFENLAKRDVDLFQGYFYARHDPESATELSPDRAIVVELMTQISGGAELPEIEGDFKRNANLGVNLLRLVNGLQLARANRIDTVGQALMMIGVHGLSRWLNILLFAGDDPAGTASPLLKLATGRGKLMELLQIELVGDDPERRDDVDRAFLVGMLSLVHVVLGMSKEDALNELNLSKEVLAALEGSEGTCGVLLSIAMSLEESNLEAASEALDSLNINWDQLRRAQLESFVWTNGL